MDLAGKVAVVTGGGSGLGAALCRALGQEGARVVVVDLDLSSAQRVADEVGGIAVGADVTIEADVHRSVEAARKWAGDVDIMVSNAGIGGPSNIFSDDEHWSLEWNLHVMSNVYAARAVLPSMLERGSGWIVSTASAVGMTNQPGTAAYVVTKHGQLALAEHLALEYGGRGIQFSCICPLGMRTGMTADSADDAANRFGAKTLIDPDVAAARALEQLEAGRFLILTHPEVATYAQRRANDHERWLAGMRRLYAQHAG
jgi:NAD(P)-dependent dehydrogenase (short-subunit alcohol dehydrogenase family)